MSIDQTTYLFLILIIWASFGIFNLSKIRKKTRLGCVSSLIFILLGPLTPLLTTLIYKNESNKFSNNSLATKNVPTSDWSIIQLVETKRIDEPLGTEIREVDNSKSEIQVVRKFTVSREYVCAYTIDYEKTFGMNGDLLLGVANFSTIKAGLDRKITEKYSISSSQKRTYMEEITLTIPAKKKVLINLNWKQVWQCGVIRLRDTANKELEIPFRVSLEPTFDQQQIDS